MEIIDRAKLSTYNIIFLKVFYLLRKIIPRSLQITIRRYFAKRKRVIYAHVWPINRKAIDSPRWFSKWPDNRRFAVLLRHDVETKSGQANCHRLLQIEKDRGFTSTFNFVIEEYQNDKDLFTLINKEGFEIGIHGLKHNGNHYIATPRKRLIATAGKINHYLKMHQAVGFTSPSNHFNHDLISNLHILYDSSTFDTDPFEPQPVGVNTIFPIIVEDNSHFHRYVELPYTIPQDFTLFVVLREKNIDIWKNKLDWVARNGGMALLNTHPDYMDFDGNMNEAYKYPVGYYTDFLEYVKKTYVNEYYHANPRDLAQYCVKCYKEVKG